LSILLTATMIGTSAAPGVIDRLLGLRLDARRRAAITITARSVTRARPRARASP